jgi:hypothetical protein
MENFKRDYKLSHNRAKVYGLTDDLLSKGYGVRKHLRGWELYLNHTCNHVHWSTTLKGLDEWVSWKKNKLIEE